MDKLQNWWIFPDFEIELMTTGFNLPVNLALATNPGDEPDAPSLYLTELYGQIKVIANNWAVRTYEPISGCLSSHAYDCLIPFGFSIK